MGRCQALVFDMIIAVFHLAQFKLEGCEISKRRITKTMQEHIASFPLVNVKAELFRI